VDFQFVSSQKQLNEALDVLSNSDLIGFDTEFVAEDCYQPDLCLLQLSSRDDIFIIDPKALQDLEPVWQLLISPTRKTLVHAGREEILFVYRATGQTIPKLFDVQVALGLLGGEYPASYGKLLQRLLGVVAAKGETRTNWRKRPLSRAQLEYAALDVLYLPELYDRLSEQLSKLGRLGWLENELEGRQTDLVAVNDQEGWHRISGVQSLPARQLGIVRELWQWREQRAKHKNMPARRVLRDDLIVELAKRGSSDPKRISSIRGLHHAGIQRFIPEIAKAVARGAEGKAPPAPWSGRQKRSRPPALLQQFLTAAMSYLCRTNNIAPAIVGTSDDVGRLASYWLGGKQADEGSDDYPNLLRGWRKEFVGDPLYDIFLGKMALRVQDPQDDMPLSLCHVDEL
jgi:ribonuclease D